MTDKKATGDEEVPADVLKLLGEDGLRIVTQLISGFCHQVAENCTLLDYYIVSSGISYRHCGTTYRSHPLGSKFQKKAC